MFKQKLKRLGSTNFFIKRAEQSEQVTRRNSGSVGDRQSLVSVKGLNELF